MNTTCSPFFRANLGKLDPNTTERLEQWAKSQSGVHVLRQVEGDAVLYGERETKPRKSHMVCIRTIFKNWGVSAKLEPGFLELLSREDFEAETKTSTPQETSAPSPKLIGASDAACASQTKVSLTPGFDERARQMLAALEIRVN